LGHPAIVRCKLAVMSRVLPVFLAMRIVAVGCLFERLRGSILTFGGPR
jgi:hypothetical protein